MMKNGILTFLFAFCPGAGQMYQGYMKRGLSLITMFCVAFGAGTLLEVLYVAMPIVWMYSFFDTFNLRAQIIADTAPEDDYLIHFDPRDRRLARALLDSHKLVGWGLVFVGVYALYNKFILGQLYWYLEDMGLMNGILGNVYAVLNRMPELLGCMAVIAVGVWLVKGPQQPEKPDYEEYQPQSDTHEGE